MRKDFVNEVARLQKIERADLIEKDFILHQMLIDLSREGFFSENFVFKGGTCLIKCYIGYYRFSEDVDFTWKGQKVFEGKSQKEIRGYLSKVIDEIGKIFEEISERRGLEFRCEKHNKQYVELGGGNKFCTFKIWYQSEVLNRESFMKVQINFVEKLYFGFQKRELKSLLSEDNEELRLLFPEYAEYRQKIPFDVYDVREILCEKVRSILTRMGIKARDFVDVYLICKKYGIRLEDMHDPIVAKTRFMLDLYEKYRKNLEAKKEMLISQPFRWGEERGLLLQEIDEKEFFKFLESFRKFLKKVIEHLEE
jgi:predicted nucleotidyltransferase component of viral defense system